MPGWRRTLAEIAGGGQWAQGKITAAVNVAQRRAVAAAVARHGALPGIQVAGKSLTGVTCIRLDASVVTCHSDKEGAEANVKGFGLRRVPSHRGYANAGFRQHTQSVTCASSSL